MAKKLFWKIFALGQDLNLQFVSEDNRALPIKLPRAYSYGDTSDASDAGDTSAALSLGVLFQTIN